VSLTATFLKVFPCTSEIDVIHVSRDDGPQSRGWKADGFKGEMQCHPDFWYEEFDGFLRHLLPYIDCDTRIENPETGENVSFFEFTKYLISDPVKVTYV
tara:strand:- start:980 stop:1276 length:297 start_codon:yes stop_codon:yes gene_type:complete